MARTIWAPPTVQRFGTFAEATQQQQGKTVGENDGSFLDVDQDGVQDPGEPNLIDTVS